MSRWTNEQLDAINADGRSLIISAAAGSGKTSVLIQRLIRIISDSENCIPVEKIIVVTFTNDAAAEMKQRLSSALSEILENNPENKWLCRQQSMIGNAKISTIHAFCFELLRENISQLSITADFRIAEAAEEMTFKENALKKVLADYYDKKIQDIELLNSYFCGSSDKNLEKLILDFYSFVSTIPFSEIWLSNLINELENDSNVYINECIKYFKDEIKQCGNLIDYALDTAEKIGQENLILLIENDKSNFNLLNTVFNDGDINKFVELIKKFEFKRFPPAGKNSNNLMLRDYVKALRDSYKDIINSLKKYNIVLIHFQEDIEAHKKILLVLSNIIFDFTSELWKIKESKNAICFDDAEQLTLKLLANINENHEIVKTKLAEELSEYYKVIMIDEFQDSNNRQDMIFRLISKDGTPNEYGHNLFFVGDVKQSIYRFRLANPDNFINAIKSAVPYKEDVHKNSFIKLNRNFRSSLEVINFVNYIFKNVMSEKAGDINYNNDEFLIPGASFNNIDRSAKVFLISDDSSNNYNKEAICIAEEIRKMLDMGYPVSTKEGQRPCEYKDFCILLRRRKYTADYSSELEKRGIICYGEESAGYLKSREVSILLNLLRIVDNPLNDTALASVMMSPMFMINADEAAEIRLINKYNPLYKNLLIGIGAGEDKPVLDGSLFIKVKFLYDTVAQLRIDASVLTLRELIRKIYDSTDFLSVMQLYRDSEKKKSNLRMLLEYAGSYEDSSNGGLSGFIRYVNRINEVNGDFQQASAGGTSQNAVMIKTMHKSKGLEFPFIFIAELDSMFNKTDSNKPYQFSMEKGIGFKLQNKDTYEKYTTLPYTIISMKNKKDMISEEMRLFYVALTRAKERIFITLNINKSACKKAKEYAADIAINKCITTRLAASAGSMNDWLLMTLISHKKSEVLRDKLGITECFQFNDEDLKIQYEDFIYVQNKNDIKEINNPELLINNEYVENLKNKFSFKYDDSLERLTAKLSVSDISKNDMDLFDLTLNSPKFMDDQLKMTNAQRGTALHRFLQFADFKALESDFIAEADRLMNYGYLTSEQRKVIKAEDIDAFLKSELYYRIKNSISYKRERKFLLAIDDLQLEDEIGMQYKNTTGMINGIIDLIIEEEDGLILADYKTDKISDINILAERYKKQLLVYKKTLEKTEIKPVKSAIIYSFYKKKIIKIF